MTDRTRRPGGVPSRGSKSGSWWSRLLGRGSSRTSVTPQRRAPPSAAGASAAPVGVRTRPPHAPVTRPPMARRMAPAPGAGSAVTGDGVPDGTDTGSWVSVWLSRLGQWVAHWRADRSRSPMTTRLLALWVLVQRLVAAVLGWVLPRLAVLGPAVSRLLAGLGHWIGKPGRARMEVPDREGEIAPEGGARDHGPGPAEEREPPAQRARPRGQPKGRAGDGLAGWLPRLLVMIVIPFGLLWQVVLWMTQGIGRLLKSLGALWGGNSRKSAMPRPIGRARAAGGMPPPDIRPGWRLHAVVACFMAGFAVVAMRAVDLNLLQADTLRTRAANQHKKRVVIPAFRGRILDNRGRTLAISLPVKALSIDRDHVEDPAALAARLAPIIGQPAARLAERIASSGPGSFPVLKRRLSPPQVRKIQEIDDPSIFFIPEVQRFYPLGEVAAHIIGFVDADGNGMEGLEHSFDAVLRGHSGVRLITRDRLGRPMLQAQTLEPARPGNDLILNINATIQYVAYRALLKATSKSQSKAGIVVVMDPQTGNVLALSNQPSFNPNDLRGSDAEGRRNRVIKDAYEPGSTFKVFTIAAALDLGDVRPESLFDIEGGVFAVGDRIIRDVAHDKPDRYRMLTVSQILQRSSNVGAAKIGLKVGRERQEPYILGFGFGKPTGIEFRHESVGRIPDITHYQKVGLANRSFGQGISVTALQITRAMTSVVNGGRLLAPRMVSGHIESDTQQRIRYLSAPQRSVLKPETSRQMREIMRGVVDLHGTAPKAALDGYSAGGKTGTAQKASTTGRGYLAGKYFASFVGFTPVEDPRLVIFAAIDEPQGVYYGGVVAAPVFREIAQETLPMLGVLPTMQEKPLFPPISGYLFDPARFQAPSSSTPPAGAATTPGGTVIPAAASPGSVPAAVPAPPESLTGLSINQALERLKARNIVPQVKGSGRVVKESTAADGTLVLELQ